MNYFVFILGLKPVPTFYAFLFTSNALIWATFFQILQKSENNWNYEFIYMFFLTI